MKYKVDLENWDLAIKTALGELLLKDALADLDDTSKINEIPADSLTFGFFYPDFLRGEPDDYTANFTGDDIEHESIQLECKVKFDGEYIELIPQTSRYFRYLSDVFPLYDEAYGNSRNSPEDLKQMAETLQQMAR